MNRNLSDHHSGSWGVEDQGLGIGKGFLLHHCTVQGRKAKECVCVTARELTHSFMYFIIVHDGRACMV
jgi:hypothetical protein